MKIYRCTFSKQLNQGFGVKNTPLALLPTYTALGFLGHPGWDWGVHCQDFNVEHGGKCDPVYYDVDIKGVVTSIQQSEQFGFGVVVRTEDQDGIFENLWWHFDTIAPNLKLGTIVETGDPLGISGNTGEATGNHVHRELRPLGKDALGNYFKTQINNGYGGACDISPYFINEFVLEINRHKFETNLRYGQTSEEVGALQRFLIARGYQTLVTNFYGDMTRRAVLKFQVDNKVDNLLTLQLLQGMYVGPKSRAVINKLLGH